jgi:hypothetical protein
MTSRASSCCVGSCRPTRHPELHFAPTCLPSCSTVEVVARLRRQCSRWRSRRRRHAAPPASGPCAAVREEALLPTAAVAGPVCRRPGVLTPPLPPASGPSAGEPVWGGRHPEQRKSRRGGASTLLRAGFGRCGSSSTVPTSALRRVDPRIGGSRILRGRGDLPLLGSPVGAGMRGAGREERGRE